MDHSRELIGQPATRPLFALIDCTSFYASCEKIFSPGLRDRPLIVLSNNDGCVVSRCPLAKRLGIPLGTPFFKIKEQIGAHHVAVFSSNYELYGDISRRVMACLSHFTPRLEVYSIDEAFLSTEAAPIPLQGWAESIQQAVRTQIGIEVTVGIGASKTLAKVASRLAKSDPQAQGVCCLDSQVKVNRLLPDFPVSELWGIGYRYQKKLGILGITTLTQLLEMGELWMEKHLGGIVGRRLWWELHGLPCHPLAPQPPQREQIAYSRSFSTPIESRQELESALCHYISGAAARMRRFKLLTQRLTLFLHTNRHRPNSPQHHPVRDHLFLQATAYTPELIQAGKSLLHQIYRPGHRYIKAGIVLWNLCKQSEVAPHLFLPPPQPQLHFMETVDEVNQLMGKNTLRPASFLSTAQWQMRRRALSPRSTTRWLELPVVSRCLTTEKSEWPQEARATSRGAG